MIGNRDFSHVFNYKTENLRKFEFIKKDPYRYVLSNRELEECFARTKRCLVYLGIPALFVYKHLRYHQELSRLKKINFSSIQLLQIVPKTVLMVVVLYLASYPLFVKYDKIAMHDIAKTELQKFDPEWFTYDQEKYTIQNAPAYQSEESVWGKMYPVRLPYEYYQTAGWIKRLRDKNNNIMEEVPPKYEFTPKGPRAGTNFKEIENKQLPFLIDTKSI